ncbi:hypothetical protein PR048_013523 [Dryococelus australis]|uniref:Uncharacterized protein n=1 Tax=Dryococelus australis TaxID=614101 RepID=A0ABQ9HSF1_9NEOP|nr:hypothetical protein PR048_013523 [Dryococelus australis]
MRLVYSSLHRTRVAKFQSPRDKRIVQILPIVAVRWTATSCGYNSSQPVWQALYECLQDIHGDSSPFLLQLFHELSNGFWPRLTSPHPAIQFVPKMFYRVEVGALGGPVQSANIIVGSEPDVEMPKNFIFQSTCHLALNMCSNDHSCQAELQPVLQHCDQSRCNREYCMEALQNFYRKAELKWSLEVAFCLCRLDCRWCRTMALVGGFSRRTPVSPAHSFQRCSIHQSPSSTLKTSMLRAIQISSLHLDCRWSMRVIEVNMERYRNEGAGETGDPRENPPTNGIVRHDSHLGKSGDLRPGIESGSPWWETENKQDKCLIAQEKLHPVCAQRLEGAVTPTCHSLAELCREERECSMLDRVLIEGLADQSKQAMTFTNPALYGLRRRPPALLFRPVIRRPCWMSLTFTFSSDLDLYQHFLNRIHAWKLLQLDFGVEITTDRYIVKIFQILGPRSVVAYTSHIEFSTPIRCEPFLEYAFLFGDVHHVANLSFRLA